MLELSSPEEKAEGQGLRVESTTGTAGVTEGNGGTGGRSYRDLVAWQRSVDLAEQVYVLVRTWPADERFGLTDQIRRAVVSIPSNIAEGQGRLTPKVFHHHLAIAYASLCEVETQLTLAGRFGYIDPPTLDVFLAQCTAVARPLRGLMKSLQ